MDPISGYCGLVCSFVLDWWRFFAYHSHRGHYRKNQFWGYQTIQMYGNFEGFPSFLLPCLGCCLFYDPEISHAKISLPPWKGGGRRLSFGYYEDACAKLGLLPKFARAVQEWCPVFQKKPSTTSVGWLVQTHGENTLFFRMYFFSNFTDSVSSWSKF